ncbi:hydroxymethylglutaryl-CoA lyase [Dyadobacter tibetensis]|uniref:hydroxymethylglutaryl-CoA lyase n=1 Tax=Dyadobacter tibetensis TaxID=1211851 RepID=UPI00046F7399|nr:hydroxymethylglutaryl-CoA lyase [Dyadobacter tibetensis]
MKIIECPRDAWQGHGPFIPTSDKIAYLNQLLQVGFDTIDFGSFVSPKAMPQVSDTAEVIAGLDLSQSNTQLLAIVANAGGAQQACSFSQITYVGYPFSISETFQKRNTNAGMEESLERVTAISKLCEDKGKKLVIYISMGFGNPYDDAWNPSIVQEWVDILAQIGVRTFSLSDTVGLARPDDIETVFSQLITGYADLEFGAHFHTRPEAWREKLEAAYQAGCRRFDGALLGYGGCPMAQDDLVGNMPTEHIIAFGNEKKELQNLDIDLMQALTYQFKALL